MKVKITHYYSDDHKHWEKQTFKYNNVYKITSEWQPTNGTKGSNWLIIYIDNGQIKDEDCISFEQEDWSYDELEIING